MYGTDRSDQENAGKGMSRRKILTGGLVVAAAAGAVAASSLVPSSAHAADDPYAPPENPALPPSDMKVDLPRTALVITDPQIDFLSPDGVTWGVVGKSVTEHTTVAKIARLFAAAKAANLTVAVSPLLLSHRQGMAFRGRPGKDDARHRHVRPRQPLHHGGL